ncbi:hypothetical protein GH714_004368 [Hevea brasiliensis]|uniref:Non-haem dioxygenase N-terminal domain-containing protein n=1 Tax=Hevea brasiliensis TaxID=3981 RepID=A0A6A6K9F1_HEVBR|nr:hypothetical protein GH714_004368 [Hevea brasiliensis]
MDTTLGNFQQLESNYDRHTQLKAFDDTKAGVKGLVDAGITKIPRSFIHDQTRSMTSLVQVPRNIAYPSLIWKASKEIQAFVERYIIDKVREACERWGFFQMINHGIPATLLDDVIDGMRRFHEQDTEVRKHFFTRDETRKSISEQSRSKNLSGLCFWNA